MAPKLTPDNLAIPESYLSDMERTELDPSIFPRAQYGGTFVTTASKSLQYIPSPPVPSPYKHERFITDIKVSSTVDLLKKVQYVGVVTEDRQSEDISAPCGDREEIAALLDGIEEERPNVESAGSDVEIITLGTGSAVASRHRGSTFQL